MELQGLQEQLQNALNEMESKRQSGLDISSNEATVSILRHQITEAENQQDRVQAQAEQIGGLKEILQDIFEAAFPKDETVKLIGLTEYEDTRETFNKLVDQAVDEDQLALYEVFQGQLEQRDERIRTLTVEALEFERQLKILNEDHTEFVDVNAELANQVEMQQYTIQTLEKNVEDRDKTIETMESEVQRLNQHVFDLQKQIANVQIVPQTMDFIPVAASESLSDRIAKAKVNSKLQLANVKAIGANWVEGTNSEGNIEVAHKNDVEPVYEFPNIQPVNDVTETDEAATDQPFLEVNQVQTTHNGDLQGDQGNESLHALVGPNEESEVDTKAEQIEALRSFVNELNSRQIDLSMRVYQLESKQAVA